MLSFGVTRVLADPVQGVPLCREARITSSLLLPPAGRLWLCEVTEKPLEGELWVNVEMDVMDFLQGEPGFRMCSWIQFLYLVLGMSEDDK